MPDLISAPVTRELVSYGIERCQDNERQLFPTDFELFDYIDSVVRELSRFSKYLKSDIYIPLVPNQYEYSYVKGLDVLINVLQIETVSLINGSNVESQPLIFKNKTTFRREIIGDYSITAQSFYTFDGVNIAYWRPVTDVLSRLKLRVARELLSSEGVSKEQDPPEEITTKFLDYIKYGLVSRMCLGRPDNKELARLAPVYENLFNEYKEVQLIPHTLDSNKTLIQEF